MLNMNNNDEKFLFNIDIEDDIPEEYLSAIHEIGDILYFKEMELEVLIEYCQKDPSVKNIENLNNSVRNIINSYHELKVRMKLDADNACEEAQNEIDNGKKFIKSMTTKTMKIAFACALAFTILRQFEPTDTNMFLRIVSLGVPAIAGAWNLVFRWMNHRNKKYNMGEIKRIRCVQGHTEKMFKESFDRVEKFRQSANEITRQNYK